MDQHNPLLSLPLGHSHDISHASDRGMFPAVAAHRPATHDDAGRPETPAPVPETDACDTDRVMTDLYQLFPKLMGLPSRYGLPHHVAEDLVQEAYVKVLHMLRASQPITSPTAYLWKTGQRVTLGFVRSQRRSPACELPDNLPAAPHRLPLAETVCLNVDFRAFARDYPEQALVLECWASGWTAEELGQALGRTPGAIREYLRQCRIKLRAYFTEAADRP
jgi:DNA-directed RNA polymerase specialized sigma24 family protein